MTVIAMKPASEYRRVNYGVLFESVTVHRITGRGVHNPSFPHRFEIWLNRDGISPDGHPTTEQLTFTTSAQSIMISDPPTQPEPRGDELRIGDIVELEGFGKFAIIALSLHDPGLAECV